MQNKNVAIYVLATNKNVAMCLQQINRCMF